MPLRVIFVDAHEECAGWIQLPQKLFNHCSEGQLLLLELSKWSTVRGLLAPMVMSCMCLMRTYNKQTTPQEHRLGAC